MIILCHRNLNLINLDFLALVFIILNLFKKGYCISKLNFLCNLTRRIDWRKNYIDRTFNSRDMGVKNANLFTCILY